jgi:riboflavin synthase
VFTGIVEEVGIIVEVAEVDGGRELRVAARAVLDDLGLGDSIAIDGVCQTVTGISADGFSVRSIATTLERTTFGELSAGRRVNLERAVAVGARLGGHMVQGHVDGTGRVAAVVERGGHTLIDVCMPAQVAEVTVPHGSITVNGISLTVNEIPAVGVVQVSIIPFTREHTNIADLQAGDAVNLEGDLIGKYVRSLLGTPRMGGGPDLPGARGYQEASEPRAGSLAERRGPEASQ